MSTLSCLERQRFDTETRVDANDENSPLLNKTQKQFKTQNEEDQLPSQVAFGELFNAKTRKKSTYAAWLGDATLSLDVKVALGRLDDQKYQEYTKNSALAAYLTQNYPELIPPPNGGQRPSEHRLGTIFEERYYQDTDFRRKYIRSKFPHMTSIAPFMSISSAASNHSTAGPATHRGPYHPAQNIVPFPIAEEDRKALSARVNEELKQKTASHDGEYITLSDGRKIPITYFNRK